MRIKRKDSLGGSLPCENWSHYPSARQELQPQKQLRSFQIIFQNRKKEIPQLILSYCSPVFSQCLPWAKLSQKLKDSGIGEIYFIIQIRVDKGGE